MIHDLIKKIGEKHFDGSSLSVGYTYHPIPFPEFSNVPTHKDDAVRQDYLTIEKFINKGETVFEIGCANGYYSFNLSKKGCDVIAAEADEYVHDVNVAIKEHYDINNIKFINDSVTESNINSLLETTDNVLMINVHMWVYKQIGKDRTIELMKILSKKTKKLFFQTAHAESVGMYLVKELKDENDIIKYLTECGFSDVKQIGVNGLHNGGKRIMFIAKGQG